MASLPRLFGTDGIRAPFGEFPLDHETIRALGRGLGELLGEAGESPNVLMGGDTRDSTSTLAGWLADGLRASGASVEFLGVVPTPAVAWLVPALGFDAGLVISASHNRHPDNGIKLFDGRGHKWSPDREAALEARLDDPTGGMMAPTALVTDQGRVEAYLDHLASTVTPDALAGLRVVLDTANGATSRFAATLYRRLGADIRVIGDHPDGRNINQDCGSTHPEALVAAVAAESADLGVAFDGDGDRALLVDAQGRVRDGDAMLFLWALELAEQGRLEPRSIVATSMSNLGLERALAVHGIAVERCDVGDRAVTATMRERGIRLGGEQSGHIVCSDLSTTGDGLLTALQLGAAVARRGRSLADLLEGLVRYPQLLRNVRVASKPDWDELPEVTATARAVERTLGAGGRLVLRYSGTEPLARIMLEGPDQEELELLADRLEEAIVQGVGPD